MKAVNESMRMGTVQDLHPRKCHLSVFSRKSYCDQT